MNPSFGIYVHIPFCLQRCLYCDFATYSKDQIAANREYIAVVCEEIKKRKHLFGPQPVHTVYFGGGTPSLLAPEVLEPILQTLQSEGFSFSDDIEITLEVNPATLTPERCRGYRDIGVNRISIGCQSFNDAFLKACNREHDAQQTRDTITLTKKYFKNFSLDLLFSLPKQDLQHLSSDIDEILSFDPPHVSAYCLTLPEKHPMNKGRCSEQEQIEMFDDIFKRFKKQSLHRYEISNFAKKGFESRHNNFYWTDQNYWGLGLSAHSYRKSPHWGHRFWNPSSYATYMSSISELAPSSQSIEESFAPGNFESLKKHESLTDFCHTRLRLQEGLVKEDIAVKFGNSLLDIVEKALNPLLQKKLVLNAGKAWKLSESGVLLSNQVFAGLLFSAADIDKTS